MKKEIIKPFDLKKAKAGAKLRTRNGRSVEIFKWDAKGSYPIKGIVIGEKDDKSASWKLDGSWCGRPYIFDLVIVEEVEEPKFKVGDWITNSHIIVKVKELNENFYICENTMSAEWIVSNKDAETNYHLWTIQDAKAGDVLVDTEDSVFIFRKICEGYPNAYGGINIINEFAHAYESGYWTHYPCFPATNKQRDLLFQKMKEAGYEWDAEKLELKKIKPEFWSDDKSNFLDGFYINVCSEMLEVVKQPNTENYNIFATQKQAKSALAMARISQIMANDIENFGGVITDEEWKNDEQKYVIYRYGSHIRMASTIVNGYKFLAFHTEKQRDLFLEKYPQLVKDYLMIPDE